MLNVALDIYVSVALGIGNELFILAMTWARTISVQRTFSKLSIKQSYSSLLLRDGTLDNLVI